jgi:hypothetical protein
MKKKITIILAILLCFTFSLLTEPEIVLAQGTVPPPTSGEGENPSWIWTEPSVPAKIIQLGDITAPPPAWQQLLSTGLDITGPATICYPFKGAQFGWVGQIRLLSENKWLPITTTTAWVPDTEGLLMACATVKYAGTYALFGYWQPPVK